jgi:hypothetical protein
MRTFNLKKLHFLAKPKKKHKTLMRAAFKRLVHPTGI